MHSCHLNLSNIPPLFHKSLYSTHFYFKICIGKVWIIDYLLLQFTLKLFHTCGNTTMCWLKTFYTVYAIFHDGFKKIVLAPNWQHPSHINFMTLTGTIMTDCTDGRVLLLLVVQCRCNYLNSEFQLNSFYVKLLRLSMYIWLVL